MVEERVWEVGWSNSNTAVSAPPCVVDRVTTREGAAAYLFIFRMLFSEMVRGTAKREGRSHNGRVSHSLSNLVFPA
jgi:hypothetical protein